MPIPLPLRNALATLALRALDDADAREALGWLEAPQGVPTPRARLLLTELHLVEAGGEGLAPMYDAHAAHAARHAARALAAAQRHMARRHAAAGASIPDPITAAVRAAEALWHEGLFFEVHEILEPHWGRAQGALREALQGLIQVAVAFHHLAHDNPRGARKLMVDGRARLAATGASLPCVDVARLLAATLPWETALREREGHPPGGVPSLPLR